MLKAKVVAFETMCCVGKKEEPTDPEGNSHKGAAENAPLGTQVTTVLSAVHTPFISGHIGV